MTANATLPVLLGTGIHSARPSAADVGSGGLYSCTTHNLVYQTDGSSWTTWASLGSAGQELSYVEFTSPVSITATTEAGADTIVTAAGVAFDGSTAAIVEFYCEGAGGPASTTITLNIHLFDGSTSLGYWAYTQNPSSSASDIRPMHLVRRLTPSAATHTYSVRASVSSTGTGGITAGAGGAGNNVPGFIRITTA